MATHLLPSPASSTHSIGSTCVHMHLKHMRSRIVCFSVHLQLPKCNLKLYMVPDNVICCHCRLRACAVIGSPVSGGKDLDNGSSPTLPFTDTDTENIHGSDPLLDSSTSSLNDTNDFEKSLQELFDEVKTLISTGKKTDAIDLLRANYEAVKEQLDAGYRSIEEAAALDVIALGFMAAGKLKSAASVLKRLNDVVDGLGDEEMILDVILTHMGSMYSTLGKYEQSNRMCQRAIKLLETSHGESSTYLVTPLLALTRVLTIKQQAPEAVKYYHRAITIVETSRGPEALELVPLLSGLGELLLREGKPNNAEDHFKRIVNIYRRAHGESDGRVGMALLSIARVKCAQGNSIEAVSIYRKAIQIVRGSGYAAVDDDIMEEMRMDLAELLHLAGRGEEGRELLEECLVITEECKGKEHPRMVTHLMNLAASYSLLKKYALAERTLRTCLQIMEKNVSPDDPSISSPMLRLAITLYNLNKDKEAEKLALRVLQIREAAFGQDSMPVGEALDCLVSIQMRTVEDDDEMMLERLQRVLKIQEKGFGMESKEVMTTLEKVMFLMKKLGRKHEILPLERRLSVLKNNHEDQENYVPGSVRL